MEYCIGMIVRAKAGRDKNSFFITTSMEGDTGYIVNGKQRPLEKPKKKKLKHLAATNTVVQDYDTNRKVKRILSEFQDN